MISKNLNNLALLFHISNGPILKYTSDQTADSPPPPKLLQKKRFNPPSSQTLASLLADKKQLRTPFFPSPLHINNDPSLTLLFQLIKKFYFNQRHSVKVFWLNIQRHFPSFPLFHQIILFFLSLSFRFSSLRLFSLIIKLEIKLTSGGKPN